MRIVAKILCTFLLLAFFAPTAGVRAQAPQTAQGQVPQWEIDAGEKMAFDVASVKLNKSNLKGVPGAGGGSGGNANVPLSATDDYAPTGGLLSGANIRLGDYIRFAYRLTAYQRHVLNLPKWAADDRFDIEARAASSNPTKDQMRLMMQSLLADRFKLAVHHQEEDVPIFALVLDKARKTGPLLLRRRDDSPCGGNPSSPAAIPMPQQAKDSGWFPPSCDGFTGLNLPGLWRVGGQHLTMGQIADWLPYTVSSLDRPIVDQTGLSGWFDFRIDFAPESEGPPPQLQPDPNVPSFLEALKEQLGLKLVPTTGWVDALVVDHIEEPSPN